jgi:NAD(P)-dependent dehydrogenase (short-subunit alcohol dehydrogenase family)
MNYHIAKSVLITGASTGIGEACAHYFSARGWRVFAGVRQRADARRLESENITPVILDVTKPQHIEKAITQITDVVGEAGLQGLVNNAGVAVAGPFEFLEIAELRRQMEVNFIAQVAVTQAALPLLRRGPGRIANMSSVSGRIAAPMFGPYAASKFALEAFTDSLRRELLPWGIHVASIEPGAIKTPIWKKGGDYAEERVEALPPKAHTYYGELFGKIVRYTQNRDRDGLDPEVVAEAVFHALSAQRPRTRYVVGRGTWITVLAARLLPDRWLDGLTTRRLYR